MKATITKERTHCAKGHDLLIHGYYFGTNQRCRECNRQNAARQALLREPSRSSRKTDEAKAKTTCK